MMVRFLAVAMSAFALTAGALAQTEPADERPVEVMVLGVYHFANPGHDLNNVEVGDVLAAKRQAELDALGKALASFKPTVVATEAQAEPPYLDTRFDDFTPADLAEVRNEITQIGYRVAMLAGVDRVYGIDEQPEGDEPDYFPYGRVTAFAE